MYYREKLEKYLNKEEGVDKGGPLLTNYYNTTGPTQSDTVVPKHLRESLAMETRNFKRVIENCLEFNHVDTNKVIF
jgi:hypothetical protein